jgi:hypothetical protein
VALVAVALNCRLLETLDLCACLHITSLAVQCLAEHCASLRWLDVTSCHKITPAAVTHFKAARPVCQLHSANYL